MLRLAAEALRVRVEDIQDFKPLNRGMTNRSYTFRCKDKAYIMRVPGEGTDLLINRTQERQVYGAIRGTGLSDELVCFSDEGIKISCFHENARVCDPFNPDDVRACMNKLRSMHRMKLEVGHEFDIFGKIQEYESLRCGMQSVYHDYEGVKSRVYSLKSVVSELPGSYGLTHIDAVPDNFLFVGEDILLIDWEYAAMCDQHLDIAMFAVYSNYDREWIDWLIDCYFGESASFALRLKIYCYIAAAGLLWSNWCEYKSLCGVSFEGYAESQYQYAKGYSCLVHELLKGDVYEQGRAGSNSGSRVRNQTKAVDGACT